MNDVNVCDEALNAVIDAEFVMNAPPPNHSCNSTTAVRLCIKAHNAAYAELVESIFPDDSILNEGKTMRPDDGLFHYVSMDDLPSVGEPDAYYKIDSTGDLFVYRNDQYCEYNPYADEDQQISQPRVMIEDDSAFMPHGGLGPLAMVYNIHALRRDLHMKQVMSWDWCDMVPKGLITTTDDQPTQRSKYLRHAHKSLYEQLRNKLRQRGEFNKEYVDSMRRIGVDVWFRDHQYGFKDGDFVATFA